MNQTIHIKNMVCPRCINSVKDAFDSLNVPVVNVNLGEAIISESLESITFEKLKNKLLSLGFDVLESKDSKLISKVKSIIIQQIHYSSSELKMNLSDVLSDQIGQDYHVISRLFSKVEGITIEKYLLQQKIEKVKELIIYNELTLSEIAYKLNYSSVAHLSSQFKREIGLTPTAFKKLGHSKRKFIDAI